jgi:hypothetical protein
MSQNDMLGTVFRETGPGKSQGKAKARTRNHHKGTKDTKNASSCPCDSSLCTLRLGGESFDYISAALGPDFLNSPFNSSNEFAMQSRRQQIEQVLSQRVCVFSRGRFVAAGRENDGHDFGADD